MSHTEEAYVLVHVPAPFGSYTPSNMHSLPKGCELAGQGAFAVDPALKLAYRRL